MSHKTVRRYQPEEIRGVMSPDPMAIWIQLEGPFVHADDYDALRTQARVLAETAMYLAENWDYKGPQEIAVNDLLKQAQAALDATKEEQ